MEYEEDHVGSFPGKLFVGPDALKGAFKSNPMLKGTFEEGLRDATATIEDDIRRGRLPSSYDVHNALNLLPYGLVDTTDQDVVIKAFQHDFDYEGYKTGKPLRRDIFFINPYLTCGECNHVAFLDSQTLRNGILFRQASLVPTKVDLILRSAATVTDDEYERAEIDGKKIAPVKVVSENFPACRVCGRTDEFRIGLHDLADEIAERKRRERERMLLINRMATRIQLAFRRYCRKMYSQARWKRGFVRRLLHYKAATKIISYARGRLARRRIVVERWLLVIKSAIPSLLRWALQPTPNHTRCFWYTRPKELQLVFGDYWKLLERTGFNPPRMIVEMNIIELGKRILERQSYLITVIQRRWRGFVARRFVSFYRVEVRRLLQKQVARVLKIQRLYRAHVIRGIFMPNYLKKRRHDEIMGTYVAERRFKKELKRKIDRGMTLIAHYAHERELEKTARMTSRLDPMKYHDNRKMRAWANSVYFATKAGGDKLSLLMDGVLDDVAKEQQMERDRIRKEQEMKDYIRDKVTATGPVGYGLRSINYLPYTEEEKIADAAAQAMGFATKKQSHDNLNALLNAQDVPPDQKPGGRYVVLRADPKADRDPEYFLRVKPKRKKRGPRPPTVEGNSEAEAGAADAPAAGADAAATSAPAAAAASAPTDAPAPTETTPATPAATAAAPAATTGEAADAPPSDLAPPAKPARKRDIAAQFGAHASRSRSMGLMFEDDLAEITASTIDRVTHDFRKKKGALELLSRLKEYNIRRETIFSDEVKKIKYEGTGGPGKGINRAYTLGLVKIQTSDDRRRAAEEEAAKRALALVPVDTTLQPAPASSPPGGRKFRTGDRKVDRKERGLEDKTPPKSASGGKKMTMRPAFKFPAHINDNPIDWLFQDNMAEYSNSTKS